MIQVSRPNKPDRSKINLSDDIVERWAKKLGKSKEEVAAAISKVGDSADSVRKELGIHTLRGGEGAIT